MKRDVLDRVCDCILLWLGVKKEIKPAKAVEKRRETKVVPAKRQHAAKKDAGLVSCLQHVCTRRAGTCWPSATCGKSCLMSFSAVSEGRR